MMHVVSLDLGQVELTKDNVQGCSDWISDSMNRTGNHVCRTCQDEPTVNETSRLFYKKVDINIYMYFCAELVCSFEVVPCLSPAGMIPRGSTAVTGFSGDPASS